MEISEYNTSWIPQNTVSMAVETLTTFQDHNLPSDTPIYTFWKQLLVETNGTSYWKAWPTNIADPLEEQESFVHVIINLLEDLDLNFLVPYVDEVIEIPNIILTAFTIPSDVDDSSVNLGLGALLQEKASLFQNASQTWLDGNQNITKLVDIYVKYSYRPLSGNFDQTTIDPRTFYWIRDFLYDQQTQGNGMTCHH